MSILYGKRADYHGFLITHGYYSVPDLSERRPSPYYNAGPNSYLPRKDLEIPLDLKEFQRVAKLFTDEKLGPALSANSFRGRSVLRPIATNV